MKNLIGHNISWTLDLVVHCSDNNVDANGNAMAMVKMVTRRAFTFW